MKTVMMIVAGMLGMMFLTGCIGKTTTAANAMPMSSSADSYVATIDDDDNNGKGNKNTEEIRAMAPAVNAASAISQVRLPEEPVAATAGKNETFHARQLTGNWRNKVQVEAEIDPGMLEF